MGKKSVFRNVWGDFTPEHVNSVNCPEYPRGEPGAGRLNLSVSLRSEVQLGVPAFALGGHLHRAHVFNTSTGGTTESHPPPKVPLPCSPEESLDLLPGRETHGLSAPCCPDWALPVLSQLLDPLTGGPRRREQARRLLRTVSRGPPGSTHSTARSGGERVGSWELGSSAAPPGLRCSARIPTPGPFKALGTLKVSRRGEDLLPRPAVHLRAGADLC